MKLGIAAPYVPWLTLQEQVDLGVLADRAGLDTFWVAESGTQEGIALLGYLAASTTTIELGNSIMQIPARPPAAAGMAVATLDQLTKGRLIVGLGASVPALSAGWYGVPFDAPLRRTREYVDIMRLALTGQPVRYQGEIYALPGAIDDQALEPMNPLSQTTTRIPPIFLGARGPKMVELTGAIADGWLPSFFAPATATAMMAPLLRGIERTGRQRTDLTVAPMVPAAVADDLDAARDAVRPFLAYYFGAVGSAEKKHNFYVETAEALGFGTAARASERHYQSGDHIAAAAVLPAELVDILAVVATGTHDLAARLAQFSASDTDSLILLAFGDRERLVTTLGASKASPAVVPI